MTTTDTTAETPFLPPATTGEVEQPKLNGLPYLQWAWKVARNGPQAKRGQANRNLVLVTLAFHANADGVCWPSQARLADMTGLEVKEIGRVLRKLEEAGLIDREHRKDPKTGKRTSDLYHLNMPAETPQSVH